MWVTLSPQIKTFIKNYRPGAPLHYRLQQLLGLPIKLDDNFFVESWVKPEDLVRPCVDPEVDDTKCEPDSNPSHTGDAAHMEWFNKEKAGKYSGQWQFPWTRLGFTYDISKTNSTGNKFGISEFVIKPGAKILIHKIMATDDYGKAPTN